MQFEILNVNKNINNLFSASAKMRTFGQEFYLKYFFELTPKNEIFLIRIEGMNKLVQNQSQTLRKQLSQKTDNELRIKYFETFKEPLEYDATE
jgi:hypothetical protein